MDIRTAAILVAVVPLFSCAPVPPSGISVPYVSASSCARRGGFIGRPGMSGARICLIRFADAGRQCTDGSQCAGDCLVEPNAEMRARGLRGEAVGQCQPYTPYFGCNATVTAGRLSATLCVD